MSSPHPLDLDPRNALACLKAFEAGRAQGGGAGTVELDGGEAPVMRRWHSGLGVCYLVDQGDHFAYVQRRHLASKQSPIADEPSLHRAGVDNLARLVQQKLTVHPHGAIHALVMDGHFEASLMLLDSLWDDTFCKLAPNGAVVALPTRDVLAFCDAKSEQGLQELQALVARVAASQADHRLTNTLYRRVDGQWYPWRATAAPASSASTAAHRTHRSDTSSAGARAGAGWHWGQGAVALSVLLVLAALAMSGSISPPVARAMLAASAALGFAGAWRVTRVLHWGFARSAGWCLLCALPVVGVFAGPVLLFKSLPERA